VVQRWYTLIEENYVDIEMCLNSKTYFSRIARNVIKFKHLPSVVGEELKKFVGQFKLEERANGE
jgi:hypothetical protein